MKKQWPIEKIGNIAQKIAMGPFGSNIKVDNFVLSGVPVLNGANLTGVTLKEDSFNYVTEQKAEELKNSLAYRGDIVVTHRGTLGQIVYIPKNSKFEKYLISQSQFLVRLNSDKADCRFITYFFHSAYGKYLLLSNASQVGVPALARPTTTFKLLEMALPSLGIQKKIADFLCRLDDKIELNTKINHNLEEQAKAIFKSWFVDFEPFRDGKFVDSELGPIPEGWSVQNFSNIVKVLGGGTPKTTVNEYWNGTIPFFSPKDITNDIYSLQTEKYITDSGLEHCNSRLYPINTVIVTARGTVGKISLTGCPMAMNQSCYALEGLEKIPQSFVYYTTCFAVNLLKKKANGAVFDAIVTRDFDTIQIVKPSIPVLNNFNEIIEALHSSILQNIRESHHLAALRDTLLPKLMSGEIDVSEVEI